MKSNDKGSLARNSQAVEQRMFKRHSVRLEGVCHLASGAVIGCKIQDVCLGGMYLIPEQALDQTRTTTPLPAINELVQLECFLPFPSGQQKLRLSARIARHFESGIGIAFSDPELDTLNLLNTFINTVLDNTAAPIASTSDTRLSQTDRTRIISSCKKVLSGQATSIARKLLAAIDEQMFIAAKDAKNNTEQSAFFDTMGILKRFELSFPSLFEASLSRQLDTLPAQQRVRSGTVDAQDSQSGLSILGDDSLESWLAVKDSINHIQAKLHDLLTEIEQRLTTLFQTVINKDNNPFGPVLLVNALDDALRQLDLDHKMNLFCYHSCKDVLSDAAGGIYAALNQMLEQQGIKPDLKANVNQDEDDAPQADQDDVIADDRENIPADTGNTGNEQVRRPAEQDNAVKATDDNDVRNSSTNGGEHDIYQLVLELRQLKQQLRKQDGNSGEDSPDQYTSGRQAGPDNAKTATYSTNELINALSVLQSRADMSASDNDFKSLTQNILDEYNTSSDAGKRIGGRESNIMDVASSLFDSLLHDMLVAESVRQWIKKLEIPLLKIALQDESLFRDKNHAARQVVNKISQLELYSRSDVPGSQNAIWKKIDKLLDRIIDNIDDNPEIFNLALAEIDTLVKVQNKAYDENIQEVVNACNVEFAGNDQPVDNNLDTSARQLLPWEKQASRLRIGDWLLFSHTSSISQRLRLAWISRNRDRYVFVNLKGLKEISLDFQELSYRLRDGTIIMLDAAAEPALDRAQYAMLGKLHRQLIHESSHDQLTGLINRREFERLLDNKLACRNNDTCQDVLCHIDIDQFGIINSTYGYEAGDKLLVEFTDRLLRILNGQGIVARIGSSTFTLLLENNTAAAARQLVQNQIENFQDYRFDWQEQRLTITLNIGLVPITEFEANATELLRTAEISCHTAKEKGSNQIHIYQPDDQTLVQHQNIVKHVLQIDDVIEKGHIELRCQRIAPLQGGDINQPYHSEVLICVRDDAGQIIPTQDFILAAEHHHRITAIDRWVITNTFEWMSQHKDLMPQIGGLAINLSGKSLNDEAFMKYVLDSIKQADLPAEWICFEITETAGIASLSDATTFIESVKQTGCHFSLDDFGSGLSSYAYLKSLPVDYLKIDGAFVKNMHDNPNDYAVVKSICEIGHFMGKKIIAEFVENETILEQLREIGIDYAQGYAIEKPKCLNEIGAGNITAN